MWIRRGGLRLVLTIALWSLAGVALVLLPGLLAHHPSTSSEAPVTSNFKASSTTTILSQGPETRAEQPSTATDFLVRLLIIMVPAMALSALGGTWVSKRVRRASL